MSALLAVLLTPNQVAELLAVPTSWVYSQAEKGKLPSLKVGKYRRFDRSQIEEWLKKQEAR